MLKPRNIISRNNKLRASISTYSNEVSHPSLFLSSYEWRSETHLQPQCSCLRPNPWPQYPSIRSPVFRSSKFAIGQRNDLVNISVNELYERDMRINRILFSPLANGSSPLLWCRYLWEHDAILRIVVESWSGHSESALLFQDRKRVLRHVCGVSKCSRDMSHDSNGCSNWETIAPKSTNRHT